MAKYLAQPETSFVGASEETYDLTVRIPTTSRKKVSVDHVCQTSSPVCLSGRRFEAASSRPSVDRLCQTTAPSETSKLYARRLAERGEIHATSATFDVKRYSPPPIRNDVSSLIPAKAANVIDFNQMDRSISPGLKAAINQMTSFAIDKIHHFAEMGQYHLELYKEKKGIDVCVRMENQTFHAHRGALATFSQYFENLFYDDISKAHRKLPLEINIQGIAIESFRAFIDFVYTGELIIKAELMPDFYVMANKLKCQGTLMGKCQDFVDKMTPDQALIIIAKVKRVSPVYAEAYEVLRKKFVHLAGWKRFCHLDVETLCQLLSDDRVQVPSEIVVFNTAVAWLNHQENVTEELSYMVLRNIRYSLLTPKQLIYCCENNEIFKSHHSFKNLIIQANWLSTIRFMGQAKQIDPERAGAIRLEDDTTLEAISDVVPALLKNRPGSAPPSSFPLLKPLVPTGHFVPPAPLTSPTLRRHGANSDESPRCPTSRPTYSRVVFSNTPSPRPSQRSPQTVGSPSSGRRGTLTPETIRALKAKITPEALIAGKEILTNGHRVTPESPGAPRKMSSPTSLLDRRCTITPESALAPRQIPSPQSLMDRRGTITPESGQVSRQIPSPKLLDRIGTLTAESPAFPVGYSSRNSGSPQSPRGPSPAGRPSTGLVSPTTIAKPKVSNPSNTSFHSLNDQSSHDIIVTGDILAIGGFHVKDSKDDFMLRMGGNIQRYSHNNNEWVHFSSLPEQRHNHAVAVFEGNLYLAGGSEIHGKMKKTLHACNRVYIFDMDNCVWKEVASMTSNRMNHALCPLLGRLYAVGGEDERDRVLNTVERYHPQDDTWIPIAPMNHARVGAGVAMYNGRLYVAGGCGEPEGALKRNRPILRSSECFDPKCHRWIPKHDLRLPRCYASLVCCGGKIYLCGGATSRTEYREPSIVSLPDIDVFDTSTSCWRPVANLTIPRHKSGSVVIGKKIFIIGGVSSTNNMVLQSIECYNTVTGLWEAGVEDLPYPTQSVGCVVLPATPTRY